MSDVSDYIDSQMYTVTNLADVLQVVKNAFELAGDNTDAPSSGEETESRSY